MKTIITWLRTYEFIAIWLEGIALVAIFVLDWRERKDQRKDRKEQHEETVAQLKVSQEQVAAAQEQVEAAQKPCLAFSTAPRPAEEAILEFGGAVGAMMLRCPEGQAQLENIGSGPAVNARYSLTPTNLDSTIARPSGYLAWMLPGDKFLTPIPRGILQGNEWEIVVTYESLSGRKYQTKITVNNLVQTDIKFERV